MPQVPHNAANSGTCSSIVDRDTLSSKPALIEHTHLRKTRSSERSSEMAQLQLCASPRSPQLRHWNDQRPYRGSNATKDLSQSRKGPTS
jgi:hypothetical protein